MKISTNLNSKRKQKSYKDFTPEERAKAIEKVRKYYYNNKEKCAERRKEWYERTRDVRNNKQRVKNNERKQQAVEYKGGVCFKCGLSYPPAVFEFHHTDPSNKDKDLTRYKQLKWDRMQIELDKCILLCANCHRLTHHGGEDW